MFVDILAGNRERAAVFFSICALSFLVNFGRVAFAPLVDHFIHLGATPAVAGLAATAVWLGSALPRLPTGYVLTFVERHRVLFGVGIWLGIAAIFTALSPGMWVTILGALMIGLASGSFFIAANPLVSELYPHDVGLALGIRGSFSQLAAVAAPALVAVTIFLGSWRYGFVGLALAAFGLTVVLIGAVRRTDLPDAGREDRNLLVGIKRQWPLIVTGIAFVGFAGFVWQGVFNFYVTFLSIEKGVSSGLGAVVLTVTFAAGVPSFIIGGRLADRFSYLGLLSSVLAGFTVCLLVLTMVEGFVAILLMSIVIGIVVHLVFPIADAYMLASLPDQHRASAYAGFSATVMLLHAPGSVVVGLLAQWGIPYGTIFRTFAVGVGTLTVIMTFLAVRGRLPRGGNEIRSPQD